MEGVLTFCKLLNEKEKTCCSQLIKARSDESTTQSTSSQSKISTRPSTRQLLTRPTSSASGEARWDWLKHFYVLDSHAEEKLKEVKVKIEAENKEISQEIESLKTNIISIQQEIDKFDEEAITDGFMKQVAKKLETIYLSKKEVRAIVIPAVSSKKPVKLKTLIKEVSLSKSVAKEPIDAIDNSSSKKSLSKEEQRSHQKCSKVHQLRNAIASLHLEDNKEDEST